MSKDNQGAIFIADFAGKCIMEKGMMDEPDVYRICGAYPSDQCYQTFVELMDDYEAHIASRRTFPYPVKEEQDGKELREGKDFEFGCDNGEVCWCDSFAKCLKPIAIPVEVLKDEKQSPIDNIGETDHGYEEGLPDTPLQPVKDEGNEWQLCPKCNGQGKVSKPPYISGDIAHWTSAESEWECDVCNGKKIIAKPLSSPPEPAKEYELLKKEYEALHNFVANNMVIKGFGEVEPASKEGDAMGQDKCRYCGQPVAKGFNICMECHTATR